MSPAELANEHWNYIEQLLRTEIPDDTTVDKEQYITCVKFHYKTAMIHGIKHGKEEAQRCEK